MKPATISDIKKALTLLNHQELSDICLRMAKFRKENKELLTFLIFEADNQALYIKNAKEEIRQQLSQMSYSNIYLAKKTIRKVLRTVDKYIKFAASKQVEVELLMYYCDLLDSCGLPIHDHPVTANIYQRQINKIDKALSTLHEDLQYDYGEEFERLKNAGMADE